MRLGIGGRQLAPASPANHAGRWDVGSQASLGVGDDEPAAGDSDGPELPSDQGGFSHRN